MRLISLGRACEGEALSPLIFKCVAGVGRLWPWVLGHEDGGEQTVCSPPFEYLALDTSLSYKR